MFASALSAPLFWIATNAGEDGAVVVNKVSELPSGHGFNAATLSFGDLIADGVIDPVRSPLRGGQRRSVARMLLTTETAVVDKPSEPTKTRRPRPPRSRQQWPPVPLWTGVRQCQSKPAPSSVGPLT